MECSGNLTHAVLLDEGYPLPAWGLDVKNAQGLIRAISPESKPKFTSNGIHFDELVFHYTKPGASKSLKYWLKRCAFIGIIGVPISCMIGGLILSFSGPNAGEFKSFLSLLMALAAMIGWLVAAYRLSGFAFRNEAHPRFIKAGGKDRTEDWNAFQEKIKDFWGHAFDLLRA